MTGLIIALLLAQGQPKPWLDGGPTDAGVDGGTYLSPFWDAGVIIQNPSGGGGGVVTFWDAGVIVLNPSGGGGGVSWDAGVVILNLPTSQPVTGAFYQSVQPVSTWDSGVDVLNFPISQAVTGAFFQSLQPVSFWDGGVDVLNWPASQAVTGAFYQAVQPVSYWDAGVDVLNFPASQAVTGAFYQATQPVSGTVTALFWDAGVVCTNCTSSGGGFYDGGNVNAFLWDGTTGPVFVTPSSTAPAAGNKALTVTISPNSAANTTPWIFQGKAGTASAESNLIVAGSEAHIDGSTPTQGGSGQQMALSGNQYGALYVQTFAPKHQWCGTGNINSQAKCFTHDSTDPTWVTDIMIYAVDAGAVVSIVAGAGNACDGGTPTPLLGPIYVPAGTTGYFPLIQPLKAPAAADDICCNIVSSSYCSLGGFISK